MEQELYTDNFEDLLKENADQFKMYPSKKVWQGIYNNVHPGTRWPSLAMSIIFIFTLVIIGPLNTQEKKNLTSIRKITQVEQNDLQVDNRIPARLENSTIASKSLPAGNREKLVVNKKTVIVDTELTKKVEISSTVNEDAITPSEVENISVGTNVSAIEDGYKLSPVDNVYDDKVLNEIKDEEGEFLNNKISSINTDNYKNESLKNFDIPFSFSALNEIQSLPETNRYIQSDMLNNISIDDVNDNEEREKNIAVAIVLKNKKQSKISWTYYLSPSVSYRNYSKHEASNANEILAGLVYTVTNPNLNRTYKHRPSLGIEAGTAMKLSLSKNLKFTQGFQVNYSSYTIEANNIHPTMSNLLLFNENTGVPYAMSSISYFGNGLGSRRKDLHNYSLQFSLPIGFEYKIAGNDRVQFHATASIQPSIVLRDKAYILSTDKKTYMTNASLSRTWNAGTNVGFFVSTNSKKLNWQIGPQVNYQLFSSYAKVHQLKEHYVNYGIRFGVSKIKN